MKPPSVTPATSVAAKKPLTIEEAEAVLEKRFVGKYEGHLDENGMPATGSVKHFLMQKGITGALADCTLYYQFTQAKRIFRETAKTKDIDTAYKEYLEGYKKFDGNCFDGGFTDYLESDLVEVAKELRKRISNERVVENIIQTALNVLEAPFSKASAKRVLEKLITSSSKSKL